MKVKYINPICTALFGIIAGIEMVRVQKLKNENTELEYWKNTFLECGRHWQKKYNDLRKEMEK